MATFTTGSVTTDGTEQTLFSTAYAGLYTGMKLFCTNMAAGDQIEVRLYEIDTDDATYRQAAIQTIQNAQDDSTLFKSNSKEIDLTLMRSPKVTIKRVAGTDRAYTFWMVGDTTNDIILVDTAAVKAKTDQLTFTVANQVDANTLTGGGGGDQWTTALPGAYSAGTAGAILGAISGNNITVVSPLSDTGDLTLVRGDSYANAVGTAISFTSTGWQDLTGSTVKFRLKHKKTGQYTDPVTLTNVTVGSGSQTVRLDLTAVYTTGLIPGTLNYTYDLQATISTDVYTIQNGNVTVTQDVVDAS